MNNYLKEAYNTKRKIISNKENIVYIKKIIENIEDFKIVNMNSDNTIYLETDDRSSITNSINNNINKLTNENITFPRLVFNTLPLSNNSCIIRF